MADLLLIEKDTVEHFPSMLLVHWQHVSMAPSKGKYKEMKGGFRLLHSSGHMK